MAAKTVLGETVFHVGLRDLQEGQWVRNDTDMCMRVLLLRRRFVVGVGVSKHFIEVCFRRLVEVDSVHFLVVFHVLRVFVGVVYYYSFYNNDNNNNN